MFLFYFNGHLIITNYCTKSTKFHLIYPQNTYYEKVLTWKLQNCHFLATVDCVSQQSFLIINSKSILLYSTYQYWKKKEGFHIYVPVYGYLTSYLIIEALGSIKGHKEKGHGLTNNIRNENYKETNSKGQSDENRSKNITWCT